MHDLNRENTLQSELDRPENREQLEKSFNICARDNVRELTKSQAFYEAYMEVGPCYVAKEFSNYKDHFLERMCSLVDVKRQENNNKVANRILFEIGGTIVTLLGACMLHLYSARYALEDQSGYNFSGIVPYNPDNINYWIELLLS